VALDDPGAAMKAAAGAGPLRSAAVLLPILVALRRSTYSQTAASPTRGNPISARYLAALSYIRAGFEPATSEEWQRSKSTTTSPNSASRSPPFPERRARGRLLFDTGPAAAPDDCGSRFDLPGADLWDGRPLEASGCPVHHQSWSRSQLGNWR